MNRTKKATVKKATAKKTPKKNEGERVFANVDEILASKIISRSIENCDNAQNIEREYESKIDYEDDRSFENEREAETNCDCGCGCDCGDDSRAPNIFAVFAVIVAVIIAIISLAKIFGGERDD